MKKLWEKLRTLLFENRIFFPHKVRLFMNIKTVKIDEKWGNKVTVLFKNPNDAVQYKMIWS